MSFFILLASFFLFFFRAISFLSSSLVSSSELSDDTSSLSDSQKSLISLPRSLLPPKKPPSSTANTLAAACFICLFNDVSHERSAPLLGHSFLFFKGLLNKAFLSFDPNRPVPGSSSSSLSSSANLFRNSSLSFSLA